VNNAGIKDDGADDFHERRAVGYNVLKTKSRWLFLRHAFGAAGNAHKKNMEIINVVSLQD